MKHRDAILAFLTSADGPVCDDCLSARTRIMPRQTVNLNCRRMEKASQLVRTKFTSCHYCRTEKICNVPSGGAIVPPKLPAPVAKTDDPHKLWHWEGNVQGRLVTWLEQEGWTIHSAADTAAKSAGKDIIAERDGKTLWVSVKGYPRGTRKPTLPRRLATGSLTRSLISCDIAMRATLPTSRWVCPTAM